MNSSLRALIFLLSWILIAFVAVSPGAAITDSPFVQEYHEAFPIGRKAGHNDVRAIAVDCDGGNTESDGVWWLLPYWMGRHYGYIQPSQ